MKLKKIPRNSSKTRRLCLLVACLLGFASQGFAAGVDVVLDRLENPWAIAFLGDGRMLVSEKRGRLRILDASGRLGKPLQGVPVVGSLQDGKVVVPEQGGLLDVVTDRSFASNRTLYFCFSEEKNYRVSTALARARLSDDETRLEKVQVIFSQSPKMGSWNHFGCRIAQAPDGNLFLAMGDMLEKRELAQDLGTHIGKVVRVAPDGKPPAGNPFAGKAKTLPEIWSYGHKNIQAAAVSPQGDLWVAEHGPLGGDELNLIQPGRNYGWPVITHGKEYDGRPIGKGLTQMEGMEQPVRSLNGPPSGMAFLRTDRYGARWTGSVLVSYLRGAVVRLELDGNRVTREQTVWEDRAERVRDVREAPDGQIYLLTDHPTNGRLLKLRP
jgi:aldose sugar dehydrogenase